MICQDNVSDVSARAQRVYAGMTAEERRADRRRRLIEAATEVLARGGWEGATVTAICERAQLIPRYFYENFRDRDDLLIAVFDNILEEVATEAAPGLDPNQPVEAGIAAAITAWMSVTSRDRRKGRVAFVEALGSEALMQRRLGATRAFADALFAQTKNSYEVTKRNRSVFVSASFIVAGGLIETMIEWLEGRAEMTPDESIDHFTLLGRAVFDGAAGAATGRSTRSGLLGPASSNRRRER